MAVNNAPTDVGPVTAPDGTHRVFEDDRFCHHCRDVALAFDPAAGRPRCRSCGELA